MKTILKNFATLLCAAFLCCACSDDDNSDARLALQSKIREAEALLAESVEGTEEGNLAPGSKKTLRARIDQAYFIMENTSREEGYANALELLDTAIEFFRTNLVKAGIPYFGIDSKMNLGPASAWGLTEAFTIEMKVRFDEFVARDNNILTTEGGGGAIIIRNNGSSVHYYVYDGGYNGTSYNGLVLNRWHHIAATYRANDKVQLYFDGELVWENACGVMPTPEIDLQAGTHPLYDDRYMRGNIQHLSIWADVRTPAEIRSDMTGGFNGNEEGLKAYWPLTLNVGTDITDQTGNRIARLTGVAWNDPE